MTTQPDIEWWYALPTNQTDEERMHSIVIAQSAYACRFGCQPDGVPRVLMAGKTTILAYPVPQDKTVIITADIHPPMQTVIIPPTLFDLEGL